ncbi:MAG: hypothetical protein K2J82_05140 [Muribaculaceae bacterium]|nr:hypothetical protein [Muribaculaceae bacterium]MDE6753982.1 hypothetical protein [Muribaculaceae bacterium]
MVKTYLMTLLLMVATALGISAQVVTSEPSPLQEDSKNVTIYFHADQGNKGMMNLPATAAVYAHTGVCLSDGQDWVNAPKWGTNEQKYQLTYVSENLWKLYIGDIREYYGITDPNVQIKKLAFVFRTGDNKKEGKGEGNADIFLDVVDAGLQISLLSSSPSLIMAANTKTTFKVGTTQAANITLSVNGKQIGEAANQTELSVDYTFPEVGDYTVEAKATAGSETVSTTSSFCYVKSSAQAAYPGGTPKMGPVKNADGSVTFCLGAPLKENVMIVGAWNDYKLTNDQVMSYTDGANGRYFWVTIKGLDNTKQYGYYFIVDGTIKVGDPYARLVMDPWNDKWILTDVYPNLPQYPFDVIDGVPLAVYQGNINDYNWKVKDFKGVKPSDLIIYELLFRDFTGTEGKADGNGTVRKAIEKIPYLKTLGVNAIELLPIMEFNGNLSWGYNPNFYFAIDKAYGTPDDYKEFIDICHQNGMAVILDMVFNQSDGLHPWYQMYEVGSNPFYNKTAPHAYSVLNDWNQGYAMVQEQWHDVLRYWMEEYKFDGFRFDLVKGLGNNDSYPNSGDSGTNQYNQSRVDRMMVLHGVVKQVNENAYFINENLATAKEENAMAKDGELNWANINTAGCQYAMGYSSDSNLNRMYAPNDSRDWGSTVSYLESHDEERLAYKQDMYGANGVKGNEKVSMQRIGSAAAQMILAPGAHMIWQFSELGNAQSTKNKDGGNNTDNKIVNWALLDKPNHKGLYDSYCELISIRNGNADLFAEDAEFTEKCAVADWSNGRFMTSKKGDKELYTIINPNITGTKTFKVEFAKSNNDAYQILSKSYDSEPVFDAAAKSVTVPANCYVVIGTKDVVEVKGIEADVEGQVRIYGGVGEIVVVNATMPATVYSLDGRKVATLAEDGNVSVAGGLYVVRCGSKSVKVVVK